MSTFTIEAYVCDNTGPTIYVCNNYYSFLDEKFEQFKNIKNWKKLITFEKENN